MPEKSSGKDRRVPGRFQPSGNPFFMPVFGLLASRFSVFCWAFAMVCSVLSGCREGLLRAGKTGFCKRGRFRPADLYPAALFEERPVQGDRVHLFVKGLRDPGGFPSGSDRKSRIGGPARVFWKIYLICTWLLAGNNYLAGLLRFSVCSGRGALLGDFSGCAKERSGPGQASDSSFRSFFVIGR